MKTLLVALAALALVGCKNMTPVGPLAKKVPITQQGQPLPTTPPADAAARAPAIRPIPPSLMVTPGDVDPVNPYLAATKLTNELSADGKATANAPVTVEVSRIRGGIR